MIEREPFLVACTKNVAVARAVFGSSTALKRRKRLNYFTISSNGVDRIASTRICGGLVHRSFELGS